jgi:hypothetical protein
MAVSPFAQHLGYLHAFLRRLRSAQAATLFCGTLFFWAAPLTYTDVLSFPVLVVCLALGNLVFACGLLFDVLLLHDAEEQAAKAPAPVAAVLLARVHWRWTAFYFLVFATLLCVPATVLYVRAWQLGASPQQLPAARGDAAARALFSADLYFAVSTIIFFGAFSAQALDASITMHDVAVLMGAPPPGFDETHQILALIGFGLALISLGLTLQVLVSFGTTPPVAANAVAGLIATAGILSLTVGTGWYMLTEVRSFREEHRAKKGEGETEPPIAEKEG